MKSAVIYVLRCPRTRAIRYVGKCVDVKSRLRQHISESKIGDVRSHKCAWIGSLLRDGLRPVLEVDYVVPADECWKEAERRRVAFHRANGCDLTNGTNGGDDMGELSEAGRRILSERASKQFGTPEGRRLQSERMKSLCADPEFRAARDAAAKATRATPEYKARMSARAKAQWCAPGYRERMIEARKEVTARPAFKERLSQSVKRSHSDQAFRMRIAEKTRESWRDPEIRERRVQAIRKAKVVKV